MSEEKKGPLYDDQNTGHPQLRDGKVEAKADAKSERPMQGMAKSPDPVQQAEELIGAKHNPSGSSEVDLIKNNALIFVTQLIQLRQKYPERAREFSMAITHIQEATWAALFGATAHLPPKRG